MSLLERSDVADMAAAVFADAALGGVDATALWPTLTAVGLADLSTPADAGGSGGTLADVRQVLAAAGYHGTPGPLVEQDLLANWLLGRAGVDLPEGMRSAGVLTPGKGGDLIAPRVPYGRDAAWVALVRTDPGTAVGVLARGDVDVAHGENLAREPRDTFTVTAQGAAAMTWYPVEPTTPALLQLRGAAGRTALMAGAAARVVDLVTEHITAREQFGRPLSAFQAIQHSLATLLSDAVLIGESARGALEALDGDVDPALPIACAKAASAHVATRISAVGHQLLGAMGVTHEHDLHRFTTRLLAWRDEYGGEVAHAAAVGRRIIDDGADPWELVVDLAGSSSA